MEPCPVCQREPKSEKDRAAHLRTHNVALVKYARNREVVPMRGTPEREQEKKKIAESIVPFVLEVMDTAKNFEYSYNHDKLILFIEAVMDYLPNELAELPREQLSQEDLSFIISGLSAAEHAGVRSKFNDTGNVGKTWALLFMAKAYVDMALDFFEVEKHEVQDL